mmetsp:Transcript_31433/g.65786  ORF Transcript_31433/g.65786 Transcript_31433/m.65786 type:complete len:341 (+) Transcript_31433:318-1340(+)
MCALIERLTCISSLDFFRRLSFRKSNTGKSSKVGRRDRLGALRFSEESILLESLSVEFCLLDFFFLSEYFLLNDSFFGAVPSFPPLSVSLSSFDFLLSLDFRLVSFLIPNKAISSMDGRRDRDRLEERAGVGLSEELVRDSLSSECSCLEDFSLSSEDCCLEEFSLPPDSLRDDCDFFSGGGDTDLFLSVLREFPSGGEICLEDFSSTSEDSLRDDCDRLVSGGGDADDLFLSANNLLLEELSFLLLSKLVFFVEELSFSFSLECLMTNPSRSKSMSSIEIRRLGGLLGRIDELIIRVEWCLCLPVGRLRWGGDDDFFLSSDNPLEDVSFSVSPSELFLW